MNDLCRITVFLAAILLSSGKITSVQAQEDSFLDTLEIDGFAEVVDNNRAAAKESATKDAIRRAVEKTVESILSPGLLLNNYAWISSVYSNSEDYIHSYSFLSESFDEESFLKDREKLFNAIDKFLDEERDEDLYAQALNEAEGDEVEAEHIYFSYICSQFQNNDLS